MLIIQRDPDRRGFTLNASTEMAERFSKLAEDAGVTLEEVVSRALLPAICAALRSEPRDKEHLNALTEQKVKSYVTHQ